VTRRSLFRAFLAAAAAPIALATSATAAPTSSTIPTGTWVTLPGTNLQAHATDATGRTASVPVTGTTDGRVTATWALPLTVTAPPAYAQQAVTSAAGYGLAVRRAG
jgi:hypothetical protein